MDGEGIHGRDVETYFAGLDLTPFLDDVGWNRTVAIASRPRMGQGRVGKLAGHQDGDVSLSGLLPKDAATGVEHVLRNPGIRPVSIVLGTSGRAKLANLAKTDREVSTPQGDKAAISSTLQANGGVRGSEVLVRPTTRVHAAAPAVFTAYDRGAGAPTMDLKIWAHLHVPDYALTGNNHGLAVVIQHAAAADFSDAADLVAFTAVEAPAAFQRVVQSGATLNRYVRAQTTTTGMDGETYRALVALHWRN